MPSRGLRIAQVTPYSWTGPEGVNEFVSRLSRGLVEHGHEVVVAAPALTRREVRYGRAAIERAASDDGAALFGSSWPGPRAEANGRADRDAPPLLAIGQGIPLPRGPRPRPAPLPLDASRSLEALMNGIDFDIVHVHDPFAPSVASAALRHSRALNVGSFHEPTERILSTQVARPLVEIFFGRLDARTATGPATAELMERFFAGGYEIVAPGGETGDPYWPGAGAALPAGKRAVRIAYTSREERGALRLFLRALRRLPLELGWEAAIHLDDADAVPPRISRALAERVSFVGPADASADRLVAAADIVCATSGGPRAAPAAIREAFAGGAVPVAAQIPAYQDLLGRDECGFLFPAGDAITLAGQIERLISNAGLRKRMLSRGRREARAWADPVVEVEAIYRRLAARRHDPAGKPAIRKRISSRPVIDIDLHMHTDHSNDCATPVELLLETAKDRGLGAIAVTDHNEISGALAAREAAERDGGIKVIVGEEVKTAEQGEVIGLFLEEKIEKGMTMAETIAEIRRQGGLVYVPHPFDRLHSVPDYEHLLDIVDEIDIIEVFNPRVAYSGFNEEAERFAAKYRLDSRRRLRRPRRTGARQRPDPRPRLRRAGRVPRGDARRRHRPQAQEPGLRPGAEVDAVAAGRRPQGHPQADPCEGRTAPSEASRVEQELIHGRGAELHPQGEGPAPSKRSPAVPTTDDQIKEKYLERAIRELNSLTHDLQDCEECPRGGLMPVLGSGHPQADVMLLKHSPSAAEIEEGVAFYGRSGNAVMKSLKRLGIEPLVVYGTVCVKCPVADPAHASPTLRRPPGRGDRDRRAALHRRDGREGARVPE